MEPQDPISTPPNAPIVESSPHLNSNKKLVFVIIPIVIVVGLAFLGGYFLNKKQTEQKIMQEEKQREAKLHEEYYTTPTPLVSPTPTPPSRAVLVLDQAWKNPKTFTDSNIDFTFQYPNGLNTHIQDASDIQKQWQDYEKEHKKYFPDQPVDADPSVYRITLLTPEYNQDDWTKYNDEICDNEMGMTINKWANPNKWSLDQFLADHYKTYAGDGITAHYDTFKTKLKTIQKPVPNSYSATVSMGETDETFVFFTYKDYIYQMNLSGGCGTGDPAHEPAVRTFNKVVDSIQLK